MCRGSLKGQKENTFYSYLDTGHLKALKTNAGMIMLITRAHLVSMNLERDRTVQFIPNL